MAEEAPQTAAPAVTPQAPVTEPVAQTPKAPKAPKITVRELPKKGEHTDKSKAEYAAYKRQEQKITLEKASYAPSAIIQIMRYVTLHPGYETKRGRDHLVFVLERLANNLRFRIDSFNRDDSARIACALIDINSHLVKFSKTETDEMKMSFTIGTIGQIMRTDIALANQIVDALNIDHPDGYLERARFLADCVTDITLKCVDPFEGMFHDEKLTAPKWMRQKTNRDNHGKRPPRPKIEMKECNCCKQKTVMWSNALRRAVCTNPMCKQFVPPPPKGGQKEFEEYKNKYALRRPANRTVARAVPKDEQGAEKKFGNNAFDALSALKPAETPQTSC